jgi:hypothetical protein
MPVEIARGTTASQLERICRLYRQEQAVTSPDLVDERCGVRVQPTDDGLMRIELTSLADEASRLLARADAIARAQGASRVDGFVALAGELRVGATEQAASAEMWWRLLCTLDVGRKMRTAWSFAPRTGASSSRRRRRGPGPRSRSTIVWPATASGTATRSTTPLLARRSARPPPWPPRGHERHRPVVVEHISANLPSSAVGAASPASERTLPATRFTP